MFEPSSATERDNSTSAQVVQPSTSAQPSTSSAASFPASEPKENGDAQAPAAEKGKIFLII